MHELPEYRPETEDMCPTCNGGGRTGYAHTCPTCGGSGACPHQALDQAWMRVIHAVMAHDLDGAYAALDQIRDGSFMRPHGQPVMDNDAPGDMNARTVRLDPIAVTRGERYQIVTQYQYDECDGVDYKGWWFTTVWDAAGPGWLLFNSDRPGGWIQSAHTAREALADHFEFIDTLRELLPDDPDPEIELAEILEAMMYQALPPADVPELDSATVLEAIDALLRDNTGSDT